jgi:hypothetical protein
MRARNAELTRTACHWGILWEGTAEQLVAAGVLSTTQADELRQWESVTARGGGDSKGRRRPLFTLASGRRASVCKALGRRNAWMVREEFDECEQAAEQARQARAAEARRMLDNYGTPERARRTIEAELRQGLADVLRAFNMTNSHELPYRFDANTRAAVAAAARELMAAFARGRLTVKPQPSEVEFERFMRALLPR